MKHRLTRELRRLLLDIRAVNVVISTVLLTATVMALGAGVLIWANSRISISNTEYSDLLETNAAAIKEKLVVEYVFYNASQNDLIVFLINCGKSNDVSLAEVYLSNASWIQLFPNVELKFMNGTVTQNLDVQEDGYLRLTVGLMANKSYSIRIVTGRGRMFEASFIA